MVCVWEMGTSKEKAKPLTLKQVTVQPEGRAGATQGLLKPEPALAGKTRTWLRWKRVAWL